MILKKDIIIVTVYVSVPKTGPTDNFEQLSNSACHLVFQKPMKIRELSSIASFLTFIPA